MAFDDFDRDVAELGERAVLWLDREQFGSLYSEVKDRAWAVVLDCYAKCVTSLGPDAVPPGWRPSIGPDGMWRMPR